jgi:hypothetical protein
MKLELNSTYLKLRSKKTRSDCTKKLDPSISSGLKVKNKMDIQPPKTMNSVSCCKDKLRVFLVLSGNALSMTLVPQDISHSSKAQKSQWKKMGWCLRCKHATPQTPEILTMN